MQAHGLRAGVGASRLTGLVDVEANGCGAEYHMHLTNRSRISFSDEEEQEVRL